MALMVAREDEHAKLWRVEGASERDGILRTGKMGSVAWVQIRSGFDAWKRLYGDGLNKDFRKMLSENAEFKALTLKDYSQHQMELERRFQILFNLEDGSVIETVVIPCNRGRTTVCVSSQVGCAMNCQFCYTGRMGLKKNLSAAEIVEQAVFARRLFSNDIGPITNVYLSPRKVTISTSGLVPQLKRFLRESNCALAVSLNATTDEVRNWIMPINRKYNLELLLRPCERSSAPNIDIKYYSNTIEDAKRLIELVRGIPCKINLISFNPHSGSRFRPTPEEKMIEFRNILAEAGCVVFLRLSRGDDRMAACGQLGKLGDTQAPVLRVPSWFQTVV
ncbi:hypothetical protein QJS10_CPB12g00204 [Acorus calamus]|uniref:Radical SAM core domain-containing protein n=1 Tax=Acorus calamus TaxID=4465 RepID=A0AAV9DN19_ACOCL|nr:hypothetical protein QJS10_CPB12g00204 [Acorus calamus]